MNLDDLFGPPIHTYSRHDALEDGVLFDARIGDLAAVTAQHFPDQTPVVVTAALHDLIECAVANPRSCNDRRGVWHDILTVARYTLGRQHLSPGDRHSFHVIVTGLGRRRYHELSLVWDGEALTFLLGDED